MRIRNSALIRSATNPQTRCAFAPNAIPRMRPAPTSYRPARIA